METNYQVVIGYKAVIYVDVRAENEQEAKKIALDRFKKDRQKWCSTKGVNLQDDTFGAHGVVDMDSTWSIL